MKPHGLYTNDEGIKKGYYVYLHRSTKNNEVFYVGKGNGKRAWDTKNRHADWKVKVKELGENWKIEIYQDDLTEIEAFQLEEKLVKQFGFFDDDNDQLTNRFPGGEDIATISIGVSYDKDEWQKFYERARKFHVLTPDQKRNLAEELYQKLNEIYEYLWNIDDDEIFLDIDDEVEFPHYSDAVISAFEDALEASKDFLNSRISWKQFCLDIEYSFDWFNEDSFQADKANAEYFSAEVFEKFLESRTLVTRAYQKVDSGNRVEAKNLANRKTNK